MTKELDSLAQYCSVRQLEIFDAIKATGSQRKAAKALGASRGAIYDAIRRVKAKAARQEPDLHDYANGPVPDGFGITGVSQYDPVTRKWIKSSRDEKQQALAMRAAFNTMCEGMPQAIPSSFTGCMAENLCNVYTITDAHVGALAWGQETLSGDWDLKIAERVLTGCFSEMIKASPKSETAVIAQLGDYLHYDSAVNGPVTPMHGNILDADGRMPRMVDIAIRILLTMIRDALAHHYKVVVLIGEGNHDPAGSVWLRAMLKYMFAHEPRIEIIQSELPYYVYEFGEAFVGWHHGHLKKPEELPLLFAAQFPKLWGNTTKRYVHSGHKHHFITKEMSGMTVVQHPTLASRDAYAARGGWIAERQATSMTYSNKYGLVATNTVTPEMLS